MFIHWCLKLHDMTGLHWFDAQPTNTYIGRFVKNYLHFSLGFKVMRQYYLHFSLGFKVMRQYYLHFSLGFKVMRQ